MPVLSAVLHLEPSTAEQTLTELASDPRIQLGPRHQHTLPVVLETTTRDEDRALWRSLEQHPGLRLAQLVFADFSDLQERSA
jgi:hypothetical protein